MTDYTLEGGKYYCNMKEEVDKDAEIAKLNSQKINYQSQITDLNNLITSVDADLAALNGM